MQYSATDSKHSDSGPSKEVHIEPFSWYNASAMIAEAVTYVFLFFALYFQVFLLISVMERKTLRRTAASFVSTYTPSVCIVVPCYNESKTVADSVRSLLALDYPKEKMEFMIIDDGSIDDTFTVARAFESAPGTFPIVKVLRKENGGKHTALNFALGETNTELIGCLDADSVVTPDALRRAVETLSNPSLAAVTPGIHVKERKTFLQRLQHVEYRLSIFNRSAFAALGSVFITPGPFTIFRRDAIRDVGGWKYAHSTEDMEIALRLQEKGYRIANNPLVTVKTSAPRTLPALFKQRVRWSYGFLRNALDYRHMLGNSRYGNLSLIVLPAALISFAAGLFFAGRLVWIGVREIVDAFARATMGVGLAPSIDPFFIQTNVMILSLVAAVLLTVLLISIGSFLSTGSRRPPAATPLFLLLYGFIVPLWLGTALVKAIIGKGVAWR